MRVSALAEPSTWVLSHETITAEGCESRIIDIDTINFYDSFTITALLLLEDLGFCPEARA